MGAGAGDPGLITQRGIEVLGLADVVLYDALVHPALLDHVRPEAERRFVGKRYRQPSVAQEAINEALVSLALAGRVVVRLKGGDPMLFARGAEEIAALARAGIPFEIVPGIPSPLAAAAYAGVPLTHRDCSSSVLFVTGTESSGKERTTQDWSKLAYAADTLCLVMAMQRLGPIARALVDNGRAPTTPAAVVQWASWPAQRVVTGTLADIAARAAEAGVTNPAVVIIGDVVTYREMMRWYDARPLFGKRIAVFRPRDQAAETSRRIRERGAEPVAVPFIETVDPPDPAAFERALASMKSYDVVVFTSANGVTAAFRRLRSMGLDARAFGAARVAAIGPATAQALAREGIRADIVAAEFRGEGLAEAIVREVGAPPRTEGARRPCVLVLRAMLAREALPDLLRTSGFDVQVVAAYETRPVSSEAIEAFGEDLEQGRIDAVLLTSTSIATQLGAVLRGGVAESTARVEPPSTENASSVAASGVAATSEQGPGGARDRLGERLRGVVVASIGPITTEAATKLGIPVHVTANPYTMDALLDALERHLASARTG